MMFSKVAVDVSIVVGTHQVTKEEAEAIVSKLQLKPLEPFRNTSTPWKLLHVPCGKVVFPNLASIKAGNKGCRYCAKVFIDEDDAILQLKESGYEPLVDYPGSTTPWKAIHKECGKVVSPYLASLKKGTGCAFCTQQKVDPDEAKSLFLSWGLVPVGPFPGTKRGWNLSMQSVENLFIQNMVMCEMAVVVVRLAHLTMFLQTKLKAFRNAGFEPIVKYPGSEVGWKSIPPSLWKKVAPRFGYVKRNNAGCAYCAGRLVHPEEALRLMEEAGFKPLIPYPGSQVAWPSVHKKCGKEVSPQYASVRVGGGCKYCADSSFNYEQPAILYLITHEELGAHKIGIGGQTKNRIDQHKKEGWLVYKTLNFESGEGAYEVEQEVLHWFINELGLFPYLIKEQMPQGGWTETVDAAEITLPTIWAKVEQITELPRKTLKTN
jgi:hypothetical protein